VDHLQNFTQTFVLPDFFLYKIIYYWRFPVMLPRIVAGCKAGFPAGNNDWLFADEVIVK
jgi:hypothetical protein